MSGAVESAGAAFGLVRANSNSSCAANVDAVSAKWPNGARSELIREIDDFYNSGTNRRVPVIGAELYGVMKLGGASKADLLFIRDLRFVDKLDKLTSSAR